MSCDTEYYLMVIKVRERLSVSKQEKQKFNMEKFLLKKVSDMEIKDKLKVEI
jgi:hypothetical protein